MQCSLLITGQLQLEDMVQPPPNVMTSSREIPSHSWKLRGPDLQGVRLAPRHKPRRCTVLSLCISPSHSLPFPLPLLLLISLFSPPFLLCLTLTRPLSQVVNRSFEVCFHSRAQLIYGMYHVFVQISEIWINYQNQLLDSVLDWLSSQFFFVRVKYLNIL